MQKNFTLSVLNIIQPKNLKFYKNHDLIYKLCYYEFD